MHRPLATSHYGSATHRMRTPRYDNTVPLTRRELLYLGGGIAIGALSSCAVHLLSPKTEASTETQLALDVDTASVDEAQSQGSTEQVTLDTLPWNLRLVNKSHLLEDEDAIGNLEVIPEENWIDASRGLQVDARIIEDLCAMMEAAQEAGVSPLVCSAYRTFKYQEGLYERRLQKARDDGFADAEAEASFWVAPPGASEHHTGLALDIVDASYTNLDENQETTKTQKWLLANCDQFGFILRYPTNKSDVTEIGYEPWHYRYVGKGTATSIKESDLCLEEWLAQEYDVVDV